MTASSVAEGQLAGRRILVVEDDFFVADSLALYLRWRGAEVVGPAPTVEAALGLIDGARLDGAVLDVKLRGNYVYPVADALTARGVRFVFATGYGAEAIPNRYAGAPRGTKPIEADEIVRLLLG